MEICFFLPAGDGAGGGDNRIFAVTVQAEDHYQEVYADGEELLGNYPDNDFCVELTTENGNPVFIRPMDARELRAAAEAGWRRRPQPIAAVLDGSRRVGILDLHQIAEKLQGY